MSGKGLLLVVDDDEQIREALTDVLSDEGYAVRTASNGQEALDSLRAGGAPDVILLDLMMPVMDGIEFLKRRKEEPSLARIPVVVLTAMGASAYSLDADAIFPKPVELNSLLAKLEQLVQGHA